jgi:hypothetical protein
LYQSRARMSVFVRRCGQARGREKKQERGRGSRVVDGEKRAAKRLFSLPCSPHRAPRSAAPRLPLCTCRAACPHRPANARRRPLSSSLPACRSAALPLQLSPPLPPHPSARPALPPPPAPSRWLRLVSEDAANREIWLCTCSLGAPIEARGLGLGVGVENRPACALNTRARLLALSTLACSPPGPHARDDLRPTRPLTPRARALISFSISLPASPYLSTPLSRRGRGRRGVRLHHRREGHRRDDPGRDRGRRGGPEGQGGRGE